MTRPRAGALLAGTLAFLAATAAAQPADRPPPRFRTLAAVDGLSQNTVWALLQDRHGFVWVGTDDGLNRFDGYEVRSFFHDPNRDGTLGGNAVEDLAEGPDGTLWVATDGGGLSAYDPATDRFRTWRHDPDDPAALPSDQVLSLAVRPDGRLWVGTARGVVLFDPAAGRARRFRRPEHAPLAEASAAALLLTPEGDLWVGRTEGGALRYRPSTGRLETLEPGDGSITAGLADALLRTRDGAVWIGTLDGLSRVDPETGTVRRVEAPPVAGRYVAGLAEGPDGAVWVGLYGYGLARLEARTGRVDSFRAAPGRPGALPSDDLGAVLVDRTGALWVGTFGAGVAHEVGRGLALTAYAPAEPSDRGRIVRDVAADAAGRLWAATGDGVQVLGLDAYRPAGPACFRAPFARTVAADPQGRLWAGFYTEGVCRVDPATGAVRRYAHDPADPASLPREPVLEIAVEADGTVWAATGAGMFRYRPGADQFEPVPLPVGPIRVNHAIAARGGGVWAGTDGAGVCRVRRDGRGRCLGAVAGDRRTLDSPTVYALHESPDGTLWVGTSTGLNRVGRSGGLRRYGTAEGLPPGAVDGVLEDEAGRVWASTNRGLARLDADEARFAVYGLDDGLPFSEFAVTAAYRADDGTLYFGGVGGLVAVRPGAGRARSTPPLVLTGLDVGAAGPRPVPPGGPLRLGPGEDTFALTYAALAFAAPAQVRYRYRLEGRDDGWVEAGDRRVVTYSDLPPGRHRFRVEARHAGGAWPTAALAVDVVRAPRWWETAWARGLAALALLGLAVAAARARTAPARALERARRRIADDLHDGLGGRLAAIALQLEVAGRDPALPPELGGRLRSAAGAVRGAGADLRDAIWAVDPSGDTAGALLDRMETVAHEALRTTEHGVEVAGRSDAPVSPEARRAALMSFREALHNALRHGRGPIAVRLEAVGGAVRFSVEDAGPGFDPGRVTAAGRGLRTMRERVEGVGGAFDLDAAPGLGTRVSVEVPLRRARR